MRLLPLLLLVLAFCAYALSCVSPGASPLVDSNLTVPPSTNLTNPPAKPLPPAKGKPSALPRSTPPPVLSWDPGSRTVSWNYENFGDYNQDGETSIADITQIAVYFGASQPFDESRLAGIADGDSNGEVNLADITPIVLNYLNRLDSYNVYSSAAESDIPAGPGAPNGPGSELRATVVLADATALDGQRKVFKLELAGDIGGVFYWARAVVNGIEGFASNAVLVTLGAVATLSGQPVAGTAPLRVTLDGSLSRGGAEPISAYRWDFDGDGVIDLDSGLSSEVEHVYNDPGNYVAMLTVATSNSVSLPASLPISVSPAGFAFTPWKETYIGGGSAGSFSITPNDLGDTIEVDIVVDNAIGLKALFGVLSYDQGSLRFKELRSSAALELQGEILSFNQVTPDSRLHLGQCLTLPQDQAGLFGDHLMATVVFAKVPELPVEIVRRVPLDSASAISGLTASRLDNTLVWRFNSSGDFNQDGTVLASDLAVLAWHWGSSGPFNRNSTLALADANADLVISEGDISALEEKYLQGIAGFNVYGSSDAADYPDEAAAPNGLSATWLGYLPTNAGVGNPIEERLRFEFPAAGDSLADFLWVRPVLDGNEGVASNLVEPSTEFFISPDWTDSDWDGVNGSGASPTNPLQLGNPDEGRTFSFIATTQPDGQGSLIDVATLNWEVVPASSGTLPEPGVLIPRSPIAIGLVVAHDGLGNSSNQLFFFAASTPGG